MHKDIGWCSTSFTSFKFVYWDLQVAFYIFFVLFNTLQLQGFLLHFLIFLTPSTTMTWWMQLLVTACRLVSVSPTGDILVLDQNAAVTMTHDRNVMKSGRIEVSTEDVRGDHGGWRVYWYILVSYCFVVNVAFQFVVTKHRTWVCQSVRKCQGQVQVPLHFSESDRVVCMKYVNLFCITVH